MGRGEWRREGGSGCEVSAWRGEVRGGGRCVWMLEEVSGRLREVSGCER